MLDVVVPAELKVLVHPAEEGGYWAECPQLQGCYTQGETLHETEVHMYEAVDLCLEEEPHITDYSLVFEICDA